MSGSENFSNLPLSCAPGDVTRLHSYCFQMKVREQNQLLHLVYSVLYDPISTYYSGTVTNSSPSVWLQTSSIPLAQQSRIDPVMNP